MSSFCGGELASHNYQILSKDQKKVDESDLDTWDHRDFATLFCTQCGVTRVVVQSNNLRPYVTSLAEQ